MNQQENSKFFIEALPFYNERVDLAAAFRWTAKLDMHEAVANHYSLAGCIWGGRGSLEAALQLATRSCILRSSGKL